MKELVNVKYSHAYSEMAFWYVVSNPYIVLCVLTENTVVDRQQICRPGQTPVHPTRCRTGHNTGQNSG